MPKVRELLNCATVEVAQRKRICHRNRAKHSIAKDEPCLVIRDPASGGSKNYCVECAEPILDRAEEDVRTLRASLGL